MIVLSILYVLFFVDLYFFYFFFLLSIVFFFFFSSRRRHTRSTRDWSSDVCSSDLQNVSARGRHLGDPERAANRPRKLSQRGDDPELGHFDRVLRGQREHWHRRPEADTDDDHVAHHGQIIGIGAHAAQQE